MTTAREAIEEADFMTTLFSAPLAKRIEKALEAGGRWVWDPDVDGVVGFQVRNSLGAWEVVIVVWLEAEDFDGNALWMDGREI